MNKKLCSLEKFREDFRDIKSIYITQIYKNLENYKIEFSLSQGEVIKKFINKVPETPGIYYFQANFNNVYKEWSYQKNITEAKQRDNFINILSTKWDESSLKKSSGINKVICKSKTNIRKNINHFADNWVAFYIGKHQNLRHRINEHITGNDCESTYALRLLDRANIFKNVKFRIYYCELIDFKDDEIFFMVEQFEKEVRSKVKPICGRQ
ncbi:hypothetical protein [Clostridium sp. C8-1-8]|uniref:hypothetical protein n=1 Tax=Clostridium sp. C8-1-8 TaxID=2698831 RepID=UPI00136D2693|nr:hypothetical protein [Clostridium sp. C8-1-8]